MSFHVAQDVCQIIHYTQGVRMLRTQISFVHFLGFVCVQGAASHLYVGLCTTHLSSHSEWSSIGWSKKQRQTKSYQSTPHFSIFLVDSPSRNWKRTQESWESKHRRYMVSASGLWPMSSKTDARFIMATRVSWLVSKNHRKVIFHLFRRGRPK